MEMGTVVQSLRGRDRGKFLAVLGEEQGFFLVCDGKERPLERPKKKNPRHLLQTGQCIAAENMRYNSRLRRALFHAGEQNADEFHGKGRDAHVETRHD